MSSFRLIVKLVVAPMRRSPGRAIVTALGVIAATCAVVWVVSGYDALVSNFDENADKYLGRYDVLVIASDGPPGAPATVIDRELIKALEQDAGVLEVNPVSNYRVTATRVSRDSDAEVAKTSLGLLVGDRPPVNGAPPIGPTLVSTPAAESPYEMTSGRWLGADHETESAVVAKQVAKEMQLSVGDEVQITTFGNQVRLRVVGIVQQVTEMPALGGGRDGNKRGRSESDEVESGLVSLRPPRDTATSSRTQPDPQNQIGIPSGFGMGVATNAIYVRPEIAEKINGYPADPRVLQVALRDAVTISQFREVWSERLALQYPPLRLVDFEAVRRGMASSRSVSGQQSQAWAATGMATLAAIFIIFSTLSMGVTERARELAMLRAVALTRIQVAGVIAVECVLLAMIGWVGGLFAGGVMVMVGSRILPGLFSSGAVLGWTTVGLTGLTVVVGGFAAAILPLWRAIRIEPLGAMATLRELPRYRWCVTMDIIGVALSAATPITVFALPMSDSWRSWCYSFVTYPMLLLGMILLAPAIVVGSEHVFGRFITMILRLDGRMLKTQLSSNLWRSVGATLALSVGLGLYASTQTWGYSMLVPFTPGDWLPDAIVAFHPLGLAAEDEPMVAKVEGVKSDQVMRLAIEQAQFDWGDDQPPSRLRFGDNGIICGLDPHKAFATANPMLPVTFVAGDKAAAIEAIASGRGCVVSEDFSMATGLHFGDVVTFIPPAAETERVAYRIAGVVSLPGWQWVTKFSGVRRHFVRTGTLLFANYSDVHRDFHLNRSEFFWVNLEPGAKLAAVERQFQAIAERRSGETFTADAVGDVKAYRPFARMTVTENVERAIKMRADGMIWGMSYLPLVTLAIMSLAIVNTIIASVRSRTWEFGVMRSIGVTRGQLMRLVLAESLLIALAACCLSLTFGLIAGWCGVGMAQFGGWFAGPPSFLIPWGQLSIGFAMTITLCVLAALWPAFKTGLAEPLHLLQSGRAQR
ncbi:ABC transporter permease [Novipirellula caenicola]|uniref:FtsX-like permease family protein n=1 Tax=Novipirellula caenicola TaxID=1536901 RepID=A0ABP9VZ47_9BACT